ncbi:hypothetical protein EYR38_005295 [Pleurotus pulmonarius]|nr:hypothetical protein EYR38_005295 [Pleurotus pulmonarius]
MGNISRLQMQIDGATQRYCVTRAALLTLTRFLNKDNTWLEELQDLKLEDIRGLGVADVDNTSEGHHTVSWIWRTGGMAGSDNEGDGLHSSLRLEWCKSQARALRWSEEVLLLKEEMRRVLAFLRWQAEWWEVKGRSTEEGVPDVLTEGLIVYARQQSDIQIRLAGSFAMKWACVPDFLKLYNPLDLHATLEAQTSNAMP